MSSDIAPIDPARFAEALKELPASSLALKVLELRNSIAHLDYSNAELKPFAEGAAANQPDQDCIDAIKENEAVIERIQHRIELIRTEVEERGLSWDEFKGQADEQKKEIAETATVNGAGEPQQGNTANGTNGVNGHAPPSTTANSAHPAWSDGTFTTGTIGGLGDEELMRRLQERLPELQDDDEEGGMHL